MEFSGRVIIGHLNRDSRLAKVTEIGEVVGRVDDAGKVLHYRFDVDDALQEEFTKLLDDGEFDVPELPAYYKYSSDYVSFCSALYLDDEVHTVCFPEKGVKLSDLDGVQVELAVLAAQRFYDHIVRDEPVSCLHDPHLADVTSSDHPTFPLFETGGDWTKSVARDAVNCLAVVRAVAEDTSESEIVMWIQTADSNLACRQERIVGIHESLSSKSMPFCIDTSGFVAAPTYATARIGVFSNLYSVKLVEGGRFTTWHKTFMTTRKWLITDVKIYFDNTEVLPPSVQRRAAKKPKSL